MDILVIGAGPSGIVAAAIAQKSGLKVVVVEKQQFPRFVIGESLLPRSMHALEEAGFLDVLKKQNFQPKKGAAFVQGDDSCEFDFKEQYTKGWSATWQMPRADFDQVLANEFVAQGGKIYYEHSVEDIYFEEDFATVCIKNTYEELVEWRVKYIIDASGYGRVLPRLLDLDEPTSFPPRMTLFAHLSDKAYLNDPKRDLTIVYNQPNFWVWLIPFANGVTSVGMVGSLDALEVPRGLSLEEHYWNILLGIPALKERFGQSEIVANLKQLKGYAVNTKQWYGDRFVLVGNAGAFLDPIFSSGVALAVESGALAAKLAVQQLNGQQVDWEQDYVQHMKHGIQVFRSYVEAWYSGDLQKIFFAKEKDALIQKKICSVLAGYVWDETNLYAKKHKKALKSLSRIIGIYG